MEPLRVADLLFAKRWVQHGVFWLFTLAVMTLLYSIYIQNYWASFSFTVFFWAIQIAYFYGVAYVLIPATLLRKRYGAFFLSVLGCALLAILLFRLVEILYADPLCYRLLTKLNGPFVWQKIEGSFWHQLVNFPAFMNALEQTNIVVWVAVAVKLFKLYRDRREAANVAELNFLKGQVHPHFLFNTLNGLYAHTLSGSAKAPELVIGFSEILRYILYECNTDTVKLSKEFSVMERFISLERMRHDNRLEVNVSLKGEMGELELAPLLLLPLVENAFKHGIQEQVGKGWVNIQLICGDGQFTFKVSNSRPGAAERPVTEKDHIGLANIRKRLSILYPQQHALRVYDEEEDLFAVILEIRL